MTRAGSAVRKAAIGGVLALAGVALACVVVEGVLRASGIGAKFFQPDARLGFALASRAVRTIPNPEHPGGAFEVRTNNLGLRRDADTPRRKPPGTYRILILGDSQTEGLVTNSETYAARIEAALPAQLTAAGMTGHVEVLNAGVSGYSPLLEYLAFTERVPELTPDLVVLALYAGNDLAELDLLHADFSDLGPSMKLPFLEADGTGWQIRPPGADGGLWARWDWYLQAHVRFYELTRRRASPPVGAAGGPLSQAFANCFGCPQTLMQMVMAHGYVGGLQSRFEKLEFVLRLFQRDAALLHVPLLVAVVPTKPEVEASTIATELRTAISVLGLQQYSPTAFDRAVREATFALCDQLGLARVDLYPPLEAAFQRDGRPLFWNLDWHLNVEGNRVVADALEPVLVDLLRSAPPH